MKLLIKILYAILGFFLISFIFYNRVILIRVPREISSNSPSILVFIYCFFTFSFLFFFVIQIISLFYPNKTNALSLFFFQHIRKALITFYEYLESAVVKLFPLAIVYEKISDFLLLYFNTPLRRILILLILDILPKIVVLFAFMWDVFVSHKFELFYKLSVLLILPLFLLVLLYIYNRLCFGMMEILGDCLDINDGPIENRITVDTLYSYFLKNPNFDVNNYGYSLSLSFIFDKANVEYNEEAVIRFYAAWLVFNIFPVKRFFDTLQEYKNVYSTYLNIFLFGCYFCAWGYVVYLSL